MCDEPPPASPEGPLPAEVLSVIVRGEAPEDRSAVYAVVAAAFGQPDEARLVDSLRDAGDTQISLVAEVDRRIVGHLALSRMTAPFPALALAPVSVIPSRQRQGVGTRLIRRAVGLAKNAGWAAIFVLGDLDYYTRFGFRVEAASGFSSPYAGPHFMALPLSDPLWPMAGALGHPPAFAALA